MMNYKRLFLSVLLLPFSINSYGKSVETRIKEFKEARFKKQLEVSNLGEMIAEKDRFLRSCRQTLLDAWPSIKEKKIALLEKKNGKELSKEELEQYGPAMEVELVQFLAIFSPLLNGENNNSTQMLAKELFDQENLGTMESFESLRFLLLRAAFERNFITSLVEKYEECLGELVRINQELADLEK